MRAVTTPEQLRNMVENAGQSFESSDKWLILALCNLNDTLTLIAGGPCHNHPDKAANFCYICISNDAWERERRPL